MLRAVFVVFAWLLLSAQTIPPGFPPGTFQNRAAIDAAASAATTTWNPSDKGADLTLSGGNLTATYTSIPADFDIVRSIASHSTGKYYYESNFSVTGSVYAVPGVANGTIALKGTFLGNAGGISWSNSGLIFLNGSSPATIQTWATGDTLCVATDLGNNKVWFRTNGGNWNNDVIANQNPATNTGGFDISVITGPFFAAGGAHDPSDVWVTNFGATAYAQTPPSGFGNW